MRASSAKVEADAAGEVAAPGMAAVMRQFLTYLRIECGLAANTLLAYEHDLKRLFEYAASRGVTSPGEIDALLLIEHGRWLHEQGLAGRSIGRHLSVMRVFCRFLTANGIVEEDPSELLESPRMWKRLPSVMHVKHVETLLASLDAGERLYLRDRALIELMYASGTRASEVCGIGEEDLFEDLRMVKVTGKGNHQRLVPVGVQAMRAIDDYRRELRPKLAREDRPTEALMLTRRGTAMDRIDVWNVVRKHSRQAGLKDVHPHTLRHSFATHLLAGGADLRVVQELLGHAKVTTTQIYTHVDHARLQSVIKKYHPRV